MVCLVVARTGPRGGGKPRGVYVRVRPSFLVDSPLPPRSEHKGKNTRRKRKRREEKKIRSDTHFASGFRLMKCFRPPWYGTSLSDS